MVGILEGKMKTIKEIIRNDDGSIDMIDIVDFSILKSSSLARSFSLKVNCMVYKKKTPILFEKSWQISERRIRVL